MNKKKAFILVLLIGAFFAYSYRADISMQVLGSASKRMMSADVFEDLGPGMHVVLCGAGGPMPDPARSGPCVAIIAADRIFIVDAGTGGARNLARFGYPAGNIEAVFLTHFHSDHIDGLGELSLVRWVNSGNSTPLPVFGPDGVTRIVDGFNEAYAQDAIYRNEHHGDEVVPLAASGMRAVPHAVPENGNAKRIYDQDGFVVEMIRVNHFPVEPAVAYRFEYAGRRVLVSGDTSKSENLQHFAEGVDLLVHEALAPNLTKVMRDSAVAVGNAGFVKIFDDILEYHATPVEAAEIARDANVGQLLYYHIVPPLILPGSEAAWLAGVDEVFSEYTVGTDGTTISLPPELGD